MNESVKLNNMREALKKKFHVTQNLPGVFFDPFAQMDNDQEKNAVTKHTSTLWNFAVAKSDFELKSVQDVLNDLYTCQVEKTGLNTRLQSKAVNT